MVLKSNSEEFEEEHLYVEVSASTRIVSLEQSTQPQLLTS